MRRHGRVIILSFGLYLTLTLSLCLPTEAFGSVVSRLRPRPLLVERAMSSLVRDDDGNDDGATTTTTTESDPLTFLSSICGRLKTLKRTGWVRHGVPFPESDADHMHRCAMCTLLLSQPPHPDDGPRDHDVDLPRLLKMALTHDLCEALAGDVTPFCDPALLQHKHATEDAALQEIRRIVGDPLGQELYDLWREYEAQHTPESRYCKDIDKFEMVLQAFEYEERHLRERGDDNNNDKDNEEAQEAGPAASTLHASQQTRGALLEPMRSFYMTTNNAIQTPLFRRLDRDLRTRREAMLTQRGWQVTNEERQRPRDTTTTVIIP